MGIFTLRLGLIADGIQSFADAGVSLIVWIGLKISRNEPDKHFQLVYHSVETLSSIVAALSMATVGAFTLYQSYRELLNPVPVSNSAVALAVALGAAVVSSMLLIYKRRAASKFGSLALKTDASNSIKDVLTSVIAFLGIALSSFFGFVQMDAIAGIVISLFVFTMVYPIVREASLVLLDSFNSPEIIAAIDGIARKVPQVREVHSIRMRKMGSYLIGDMHVVLDGDLSVADACAVTSHIEAQTQKMYPDILEMNVIIEPHKER
jgi:cation diffusion facilitator family transporter